MSIVPGVVCSVARVLDLATAFAGAPATDTTLFPLGALDKLVSLRQYVFLLLHTERDNFELNSRFPFAACPSKFATCREGTRARR
jgi:hypothetical protein